jgi:hypothetical protein
MVKLVRSVPASLLADRPDTFIFARAGCGGIQLQLYRAFDILAILSPLVLDVSFDWHDVFLPSTIVIMADLYIHVCLLSTMLQFPTLFFYPCHAIFY